MAPDDQLQNKIKFLELIAPGFLVAALIDILQVPPDHPEASVWIC